MTKNKFIIENVFFFLLLCGIGIQISLSVFFTKSDLSFIIYITNNWLSGIQYSFNFDHTDSCDEDDINILHKLNWKGTVGGGRDYFDNLIRMDYNQTAYGYKSIKSSGTHDLHLFNGTLVCAKTIIGNYLSMKKSKDCYLKNNSMTIDSLGNYLCDSNIKLNSSVFTSYVISETQPCLNPDYLNEVEGLDFLDYYYDKNKCPEGKVDSSYEIIKEMDKNEFFIQNNISNVLKEIGYNYTIPSEQKIKLYGRKYIGLYDKENCKINQEDVVHINTLSDTISKANNWNVASLILYLAFFLLFLVRYSVVVAKYYSFKEKSPSYVKPILMIISIINFIVSCVIFTTLNKIGSPIQEVFSKKNGCLEEDFLDITGKTVQYIMISYYFSLSSMVVQFIIGIKYGIRTAIKYAN